MRQYLRLLICSLLTGLALSLLIAAALSLRGAGSGPPTAVISLDMNGPFPAAWMVTADQTGHGWNGGWTRRGRAMVSPQAYGVSGSSTGAASLTLSLDVAGPAVPPFPIALPPRATLADLDLSVVQRLKAGPPGGTLLAWPVQTQFGWPLRCAAYWNDGVYGWGSFGWSGGARKQTIAWGLTLRSGTDPFNGIVVPCEPLPIGLALDTLVWGATAGVVIVLLRWMHRRRRRRAGQCEACGYELASLAICPECNTKRRNGLVTLPGI